MMIKPRKSAFLVRKIHEWTIYAYLRGASAIDLQSTAQGNMHEFNVPASISKDYKAGHYGFSLRAVSSDTGEVEELETLEKSSLLILNALKDVVEYGYQKAMERNN